jgi:hypothetical protein
MLERIIGNKGTVKPTSDGFEVTANLVGERVRDLNRVLLSEMRKVEKKTRLRRVDFGQYNREVLRL